MSRAEIKIVIVLLSATVVFVCEGVIAGDEKEEGVTGLEELVDEGGETKKAESLEGEKIAPVTSLEAGKLQSAQNQPVLSHPTESGFSGLIHMVSGDSGDPWSWAVGIQTGFFVKDGFIVNGDKNRYVSGLATFRYTIWKYFESAVSLKSFANYNEYGGDTSIQFEPPLFQTLGDVGVGLRGFYPVVNWLSLGLGYRVIFLNKVGKVGIGAANHELLLPVTFDIKKATRKVPIRVHLNVGYTFDESRKLVEDEEKKRGQEQGTGCEPDENNQYNPFACISPVERFGLGINRNDLVRIGLGLEFPVPYVDPFAEVNFNIPVNRQGFNCGENLNTADYTEDDYCLNTKGFSAFPNNITIGFRVRGIPYNLLKGLGLLAAADIAFAGMKRENRVRELAMNPPYMVYFGVSYTPTAKTKEVVKIQQVVRTEIKEPPPKPRIVGKVVDAETKVPIEGAIVAFAGKELTRLVTGSDGSFVSYPLEEGEYEMEIKAKWYFDSTCTAKLEKTGDTTVECEMRPMPKLATITGQVLNARDNSPLSSVNIVFKGPRERSLVTDASGSFSIETEAGEYRIQAQLEGYFSKIQKVKAPAGGSVNIQFMLSKKPKRKLVILRKKVLRIGKKIQFEFNSATIKPRSYVVLDSVADFLIRHPEIQVLEIQGHTDNRGKPDYNMKLSQERASSVRDYLISCGVEPERLIAKGYGQTKPIAPNVTSAGRAKNRRVEFHILSTASK